MAEKPQDQETVPYERLQETIADKNTANADKIRAQQTSDYWKSIAEKNQAKPQDVAKVWTKPELETKVTANEMSKDDAQAILDEQFLANVKKEAKEGALEAVRAENFDTRQTDKFKAYQELHPDAFKMGSDQHTNLKTKFDELVANGLPSTKATELVALEITLGSSDIPKQVETPSMSSGVGDSGLYGDESVASSDGIPAKVAELLTPRLKVYYKDKVDQGYYTWDQVAKEAGYINQDSARKHDLMHGSKRKRS